MKDRSFSSAAALYLIWNRDLSGKSSPDPNQITQLAQTLRDDFAAIEAQFVVVEDPNGDIARARVTLVYGQDTSDAFFALLDDTIAFTVNYTHPSDQLENAITDTDPAINYNSYQHLLSHRGIVTPAIKNALESVSGIGQQFKDAIEDLFNRSEDAKDSFFMRNKELNPIYDIIRGLGATTVLQTDYTNSTPALDASIINADNRIQYDDTNKKLLYNGILTISRRNTLKNIQGTSSDFQTAIDALFSQSQLISGLDATTVLQTDYKNSTPELDASIINADNRIQYDDRNKKLLYNGILTISRRDTLKNIQGTSSDFQTAINALFSQSQLIRGESVLAQLDPILSLDRKRQQALQRLSSSAGIDVDSTQTLLYASNEPFPLHANNNLDGQADNLKNPAIKDVLALQIQGLSVTGNIDQNSVVASIDYGSGRSNALPAGGGVFSGNWSGQIEIPEDGYYNFIIETDATANVTFTLDKLQPLVLTQNGNIRRNSEQLLYKGGALLSIAVNVQNIQTLFSLKWETPKRPREVIPSQYLYPSSVFDTFTNVYIRFLKAASLMTSLSITANELAYFATNEAYQINNDGWVNILSVNVNEDPTPANAIALLKPFKAILNYSRIKADISPNDESLLQSLQTLPAVNTAMPNDSILFIITRWNIISFNDLLAYLGKQPSDLADFGLFMRVYDAFKIIQQTGISARSLIQATTNDPAGDTVRKMQAALRALYDPDSWRSLVKPINDEMRSLQRDALVAYILHQMSLHPESSYIDTPDKLFEYFLMDVQMDPCMQTSRIRHALSSVQLFTDRCIMQLERYVDPSVFSADQLKQWDWMKRYRVWQANREVLLWPENWAEPELRDDQSSFFKETMSELLQSDITDDSAATALLNYLTKLEEVAKLEPCGIFHIEGDEVNNVSEVDHVIARTAGAKRKYYYRRLDSSGWSPWEEMKLDIEDNPVIPVVWSNRLFVFWLKIIKTPVIPTSSPAAAPNDTTNPLLANATIDAVKQSATGSANTQIKINAVLSYSEYYNGKWQPTKTSDVNYPILLGNISHENFDRRALVLNSYETSEGLNITVKYNKGGLSSIAFLLYNTHSLPTDSNPIEPINGQSRSFVFTNNTLMTIVYYQKNLLGDPISFDRPVLKSTISKKNWNIVDSNQFLLSDIIYWQNAWQSPFFFEDAQNLFYVTTKMETVSIRNYNDLSVAIPVSNSNNTVIQIPPLMVKAVFPDNSTGELNKDNQVLINRETATSKQLLSDSSLIRQGLSTIVTFKYGNTIVGIAGKLAE